MLFNKEDQAMKESKLRSFLAAAFAFGVFAFVCQSTRPILADGATVLQRVSYPPVDMASSPSGSMARTKKIRMACYPVGGECTKNFDCCSGFCRSGRVTAYCDNP
jgi:hypothetical protein